MTIITKLGIITVLIPTILSSNNFALADRKEQNTVKIEIEKDEEKTQFFPWRFMSFTDRLSELRNIIINNPQKTFNINIQDDTFVANKVEVHSEEFQPSEELLNKIEYLVQAYPKDVSFYGVSLDGKISFGYNPDTKYSCASSIKAPYSLYCYKQIEEGNATFNETIAYKSDYYSTGTGVIKSNNQTQYTLEELLYNTIHYSDNIAYGMVYERFGIEGYNKMLEELGCTYLQLTPYSEWGFSSPREMALIWQEIYRYKDTETGKKFFDTLLNAQYNFLKDTLPDYDIPHKSGWSERGYNDHGIVFADTPYIISIMMPYPKDNDNDQAYFKEIAILCNEIMNEYNYYLENKKVEPVKTYKLKD